MHRFLILLSLALPLTAQDADPVLAEPPREFRAAWVATVANIDWPSKPGLPVDEQQAEALRILDRLVALGMNAVVFQVRPQADALYESKLEPWSYFLTGRQGQAPEPFYDPLEFWIDEAHARGLLLHAWFNPYRANHPSHKGPLSPDSLVEKRPELVVKLGNQGYWWMDPALPAVQEHSLAVVMDVVTRYDVDGVHFDDYFYPYASYHDGEDFPDQASYDAYRKAGGKLERGDWRRAAVDGFIEKLYRRIRAQKKPVEFGISPFGIWRPGHPDGIQGLDQYEALYADAKRWLNEGWVDYFTPQLYWPIAQIPQSFPVLLGWWDDQNTARRHLWPGTSIGRARGEAGVTEILNQILLVRGMLRRDPGICMFSMKVLMPEDGALPTALRKGPWSRPALVPASPWLDDKAPRPPKVELAAQDGATLLRIEPRGTDTFLFVVDERRGARWSTAAILPAGSREHPLPDGVDAAAVRAVDRARNLSAPTVVSRE
jgi:uncharacterized lipoprotein YddW (UPF0748 family)